MAATLLVTLVFLAASHWLATTALLSETYYDEALTGLMGLSILHGTPQVFYWGQLVERLTLRIPPNTPPGPYEIRVGVWRGQAYRRWRGIEADRPHTRNTATVAALLIRP